MKVLFFSPFANIWEHSFPEALVAESYSKNGVDVVAVRCDGMLQTHCVAMSAAGVGPEASLAVRQQVCHACIKRRDLITREMGIPALILDSWVTDEDRARAEELISTVTPQTWTSLTVEGVPLGRYAVYEIWLNNKLVSTDLEPAAWAEYVGQLRNTLLVFFAASRILERESPDAVIVYNDHYSVNHAFCAAAQLRGIPTYTTHGGSHVVRRGETLSLFVSNHTQEDTFRSEAWQSFKNLPVSEGEVVLVGQHFDGLLEASSAFAYSSAFKGTSVEELRSQFAIAQDKTVLLAALSSEDELIAVRLIDAMPSTEVTQSLFESQFEWLEFLIEYLRSRPDLHLIVRLHPRMFPNKRELVQSPSVLRIEAMMGSAPANVTFNTPADGIGLYDVMQIVDVLLNFRSSVGAELAALGIPVVVPANSDFYTYPGEINRIGHTTDEFKRLIDEAVAEGWSIENSRRAFRWFAFLFGRVAVDFSDAVSSRPIAIRPQKPGFRLWVWKKLVYVLLQYGPMIRERLALRNRRVAESSQAILLDVVTAGRASAADSPLWPPIVSTTAEETELLEQYLLGLTDRLWGDITAPDSLAGRIRSGVQ